MTGIPKHNRNTGNRHNTALPIWPRRHQPVLTGRLKSLPEDFQVEELLPVTFSGNGEHLWLWLEKTGANTEWAARQLARACQVSARVVGYAGLKDRHGITRQWFSIQLPRVTDTVAIQAGLPDELRVLESHWHHRKLQTGALRGNRFTITLRAIRGNQQAAENILQGLKAHGFPNYFGAQRFGHQGQNIAQAQHAFETGRLPRQRHKRGLLLSAARAFIFNQILAERIRQKSWGTVLAGDVLQLAGSRSWFVAEADELTELQQRQNSHDLHLTAALWGCGPLATCGLPREQEVAIATQHATLADGLEAAGLRADRRAMRCLPEKLEWQWHSSNNETILKLRFSLPAGCYATELLAEIGLFQTPSGPAAGAIRTDTGE